MGIVTGMDPLASQAIGAGEHDRARAVLAAGIRVALLISAPLMALIVALSFLLETFGVAPDGRTGTAGGWGYLLGDEGSAYAVGREALRAVGHAADGHGRPTALTATVSAHLRLAQPRDLITAVYQSASPRTTIADLAPLVAEAARAGDAVATEILAETARALATAAVALARRLDLPSGAPVVGVGGMLGAGPAFREALDAALIGASLQVLRPLEADPALGALRLATGEVPVPQAG